MVYRDDDYTIYLQTEEKELNLCFKFLFEVLILYLCDSTSILVIVLHKAYLIISCFIFQYIPRIEYPWDAISFHDVGLEPLSHNLI